MPEGRMIQGSSEPDGRRFGNSMPCVRCLRALETVGVHRVVFTTGAAERGACGGAEGGAGGCIPCEVRTVRELIEAEGVCGHSSRGDVEMRTAYDSAKAARVRLPCAAHWRAGQRKHK